MGNIVNYLKQIITSEKGKDVRQSMHDAIKQVYDDAATSGNANMEVTFARGTENTLNDRLTKMDQVAETTTAELAQIETQKAEKTDLEVERARIDNLVVNPGDGTTPPELTDIHVGADAITHDSAGDAVRQQFKYLLDSTATFFTFQTGIIWNNGLTSANTDYTMSDFKKMYKGQMIVVYGAGATKAQQLIVQKSNYYEAPQITRFPYPVEGAFNYLTYVATEDCYVRVCGLNDKIYAFVSDAPKDINDRLSTIRQYKQYILDKTLQLTDGYVNANTGGLSTLGGYKKSDLFELKYGEYISVTAKANSNVGAIVRFTSDGTLIKTVAVCSDVSQTFLYTPTEQVEYLRISGESATLSYNFFTDAKESLKDINSKTDKSNFDVLVENLAGCFNNYICIGDSLTEGDIAGTAVGLRTGISYPNYFAKLTGSNVTNAGDSGKNTQEWYDLHFNQYNYADYDCAIICLGQNDGLPATVSGANTNDLTGYYCTIIEGIKAQNPNIKIVLLSIEDENHSNVIEQIADYYDIRFIDIHRSGYFYLASKYSSDYQLEKSKMAHPIPGDVHFGRIGYMMMAKNIFFLLNEDIYNNFTYYEMDELVG